MIYHVAFRDVDNGMAPVTRNGRLATFATDDAAKAAAGPLGVSVAQPWAQIIKTCLRYNVEPPVLDKPVQMTFGGMA